MKKWFWPTNGEGYFETWKYQWYILKPKTWKKMSQLIISTFWEKLVWGFLSVIVKFDKFLVICGDFSISSFSYSIVLIELIPDE